MGLGSHGLRSAVRQGPGWAARPPVQPSLPHCPHLRPAPGAAFLRELDSVLEPQQSGELVRQSTLVTVHASHCALPTVTLGSEPAASGSDMQSSRSWGVAGAVEFVSTSHRRYTTPAVCPVDRAHCAMGFVLTILPPGAQRELGAHERPARLGRDLHRAGGQMHCSSAHFHLSMEQQMEPHGQSRSSCGVPTDRREAAHFAQNLKGLAGSGTHQCHHTRTSGPQDPTAGSRRWQRLQPR